MTEEIHKTVPVQVLVAVDERIAPLVAQLQRIPDMRTYYSCQGRVGAYRPYVGVGWLNNDAVVMLCKLLADWHDSKGGQYVTDIENPYTATLDDFRAHTNSATLHVHWEYLAPFTEFVTRWLDEHLIVLTI